LLEIGKSKHSSTLGFSAAQFLPRSLLLHISGAHIPVVQVRLMPTIVKPAAITWGEVLRRTWKEAWEDDILGRSAQLSYYFFSGAVSGTDLHDCHPGYFFLERRVRQK
jgi:hypothetical protein